jgi:Icc-related predicted phosphoesterase
VARILAIADEVDAALYGDALHRLRPDVIVSCGDLPHEYLENLVTRASVPLVYVPGNHDVEPGAAGQPGGGWPMPLRADDRLPGPQGCESADGRVIEAAGLRFAGLGGSIRYKEGPNQYTQREIRFRALRLEARVRLRRAVGGRGVDVLVTHAPPLGVGDGGDHAHQGFAALHRLVRELRPRLLVHGHVHPVHRRPPDRSLGTTLVVNVIPYRLLEL